MDSSFLTKTCQPVDLPSVPGTGFPTPCAQDSLAEAPFQVRCGVHRNAHMECGRSLHERSYEGNKPGRTGLPGNSDGLPFLRPQIVSAAIAGGGADAQMPTPKFFDDASEPGTVQTWGRRHVGPCGRDRCEPSTYGEVGLSLDLLRSAVRQRGSEVALSMSRHGLATRPDSGWHPGNCETSSTTGKTSTARSPTTS